MVRREPSVSTLQSLIKEKAPTVKNGGWCYAPT